MVHIETDCLLAQPVLRVQTDAICWIFWGGIMGKQARVGLLLGATACLVAVMIDWVIREL